MEKSEEVLEKLKVVVNGGRERLDRSGTLPLEYITDIVCPLLQDVLKGLCRRIEDRHKLDETENENYKYVIHYTSIATLVSMLQDASKGDKKSSLRLYDSVHLNDPDEGNYLARNLLPQKYNWLGKTDVRHAYITSFIFPNSERDMSDNLVFWRTYGQEGEGCALSLRTPLSGLRKVFYGSEEESVKHTVKELQSVLEQLDPLVEIDNTSTRDSIQKELAETVWESLEKIRYLYKSEAYEYENECRFVIPELDIDDREKISIEYQDRNDSPARIRHYYENFEDKDFQLNKLMESGSSITLGPCVPYRDNVRYCIEELKRKAGLHGPEVKDSKILYQKS